VFGKTTSSTVDLGALGAGGYKISGALANDHAGEPVAGGNDFNGDGRPDVLVSAHAAGTAGRTENGSVYVVYGKTSKRRISLGTLPESKGYRIDGPQSHAESGRAIGAAKRLFGPGSLGREVLVGAPRTVPNGRLDAGSVFVVNPGPAVPGALHDVEISGQGQLVEAAALRAAKNGGRARIVYRLRRKAKVTLRFLRRVGGRRAGSRTKQRCVKASKAPANARKCDRLLLLGKIQRTAARGKHSFAFPHHVAGRKLSRGSYLLAVTAREANGRVWGPALLKFRIRRKGE
jgi:hypothetical protein